MEDASEIDQKITEILSELSYLDDRRSQLKEELILLRQLRIHGNNPAQISLHFQEFTVNNHSSQEEKIHLFRSLFKGREDVFPRRFVNNRTGSSGYAPVCRNEWRSGICQKPKIPCQKCNFRAFTPLSDDIIRNHLQGFDRNDRLSRDFTIGIYMLMLDETCYFLAVDFDKSTWKDDSRAFLETCSNFNIPAVLERSRSGNGGHVWIFFESSVTAISARRLGTFLLTITLENRPEIGMDSYDRLFPSQDTLPKGGFGNLIALPLQKKPREQGNSVFVDLDLIPYPDQWTFLSGIQKMTQPELDIILKNIQDESEVTGVRSVIFDELENEPWKITPSQKYEATPFLGNLPEDINLVISNQIYLEKDKLSAPLRNRIIRLAAFQNPEFYKSQAMRLSTYGKPRIISCCEEFPKHLALPRGCLEELNKLFEVLKINPRIEDERNIGMPITPIFKGRLRPDQKKAAEELLKHDTGVLSAATAFGKTVIGTWLIAQRKVNTLIIVHRRQLMAQWIQSLQEFLGLGENEIGQFGAGKQKITGLIDVAMIQSLIKKRSVNDLVAKYGQVIVDECHHISASSFEQVIRQAKAKFITGLSATVIRKDGHHPIIFMQCGPLRYKVDDRYQAELRSFDHKVIVRKTMFSLPKLISDEISPGIQQIYALLAKDPARNKMIIDDVLAAIASKRSPVLLTERKEHLEYFAESLSGKVHNIIVLTGGMSRKKLASRLEQINQTPSNEERLIISTGRFLGEGFDNARLDTLFLALPISWRGTVAQYAGRLHRSYEDKSEVMIYDYFDDQVPVLAGMFAKRNRAYKAIGYSINV